LRDGSRGVAYSGGQAGRLMPNTHNGRWARGRPAVAQGEPGSPSARPGRRLAEPGPVALLLVACPAAPWAAAQRAVDGAQVGGVERQVGPLLARDDVIDGAGSGMAAEVADVRGGEHGGADAAPWPPGGPVVTHLGLRRRRWRSFCWQGGQRSPNGIGR
jgi:hypothetical protein